MADGIQPTFDAIGKFSHVGLFYLEDERATMQLHLAWHHDLRRERVGTGLRAWTSPRLDRRRAVQVAAFCRRVWRKNKDAGLPYAFSCPVGALGRRGALKAGITGLTCASFVLAVFDATGLSLVEYGSWSPNEEGEEWQKWVCEQLDTTDPSQAIEAAKEVPALRYQPYQVLGAALAEALPADLRTAERQGQDARARVSNWPPG